MVTGDLSADRRAPRRTVETVLEGVVDGAALARATEFRFASTAHVVEAGPLGEIWQVAGRVGFYGLVAADTAVMSLLSDSVRLNCSAILSTQGSGKEGERTRNHLESRIPDRVRPGLTADQPPFGWGGSIPPCPHDEPGSRPELTPGRA